MSIGQSRPTSFTIAQGGPYKLRGFRPGDFDIGNPKELPNLLVPGGFMGENHELFLFFIVIRANLLVQHEPIVKKAAVDDYA